ncbi:NAD-binding protein [Methylomonas sp. MO1]|uniref:potassium channel family protein n=1 Tax=unclassified Methylomonas TaxID=2608980 RepID=UPI000479132E|nr:MULTISPECIES: NAD-binding protein [unclassified Methylomonas]MDT4289417.1 NAD-binding protein [Methylomonas sp. MO1]
MKNIAVFGYNRLSFEAISRLDKELYQITVIDHDPAKATLARENGFETANIDFRSDDDLKLIGIGAHIDTLFCFFDTDSENVFLTLSARALDKQLNIVAIVDSPESAEKLLAAGANKIIDPYEICGRKIHDMLKRPDINDIFDHTVFGRHDLHLAEVTIPENSYLENTHVTELQLSSQYNLILIGIVNKQVSEQLHFVVEEFDRRLSVGDILVILGPSREIRAFKKDVENEFSKN